MYPRLISPTHDPPASDSGKYVPPQPVNPLILITTVLYLKTRCSLTLREAQNQHLLTSQSQFSNKRPSVPRNSFEGFVTLFRYSVSLYIQVASLRLLINLRCLAACFKLTSQSRHRGWNLTHASMRSGCRAFPYLVMAVGGPCPQWVLTPLSWRSWVLSG